MGIFSRLKALISSNINHLINKAEKPEKMLNQAILDMNEQLVEAKKSVAMAIANEKKLERETVKNKEQSAEWERKAILAVKAGKDDLAKEALVRKAEYDNYVAEYEKQWGAQKESVEKLKSSLLELQSKIDEAVRKKDLLIARAKSAEAQQKIQSTMASISGNRTGFDTFERMAQKVDALEAEAGATKELAELSADKTLEKKFAELEGPSNNADQLLLNLKQQMGVLPPADESNPALPPSEG
jgi:phage shock protein A